MAVDRHSTSAVDFEAELRLSPRLVAISLPVIALLLYVRGHVWSQEPGLLSHALFVLLAYLLGAAGWLVTSWRRDVGRWLVLASLLAAVYLADMWLGVPGFLALAGIATALAVPLISLRAAAGLATAQTLALLILPRLSGSGVDNASSWVAVLSIWGGLAVMLAVYRPVHQVTRWSEEYFEQAQQLLEEARHRQAALRQALDDLAQANLQLTRMNQLAHGLRQLAEEARVAKEHFVANVSHELRTPLNMIIGFSELITRAPKAYGAGVPTALLADLTVIRRNAEHLADLVDDVLDLSQIEADRMALVKDQVDFREVIDDAVEAVQPLFRSKELYLQLELPKDLPPVFCDRTRMREVVLNLLSNAGRFTVSGGVRVRAWSDDGSLWVAIADTGKGIAAADLSKLFRPFGQVDGSIHRRYGGTGLGLSISKRFIELHGGRISVESEEGKGTTFTFRIPCRLAASVTVDYSRWLAPDWEYRQRTRSSATRSLPVRARYVILEATEALAPLLRRYMDDIEIVSARSVDDAVEALVTAPSTALLVNEPTSGTWLQRVKCLDLPYRVPVLACSVAGAAQAANVEGICDYLVKPVSREALLNTLDRLSIPGGGVLVVDDESEALRLFRRMLGTAEPAYRVMRARSGQEALAIMRRDRPDAVLVDLVMPNMDGFQLLEAKRQDAILRDIPTIVVSAQDPGGHPIVSDALTVTQPDGLSTHTLLRCIRAISEILSVPKLGGLAPPAGTPA